MKKIILLIILQLFYVNCKSEVFYPTLDNWVNVLNVSKWGDTIYFPNEKLIINEPVSYTIPKGVTLKSETGVIKCNYFSLEREYKPLFFMESYSCIMGMTLIGDNGEVGEPGVTLVQNAIKTLGEDCKILNCYFLDFDKWAVWGYDPSGLLVQNCRFENIRREGYGYGVWIGGRGGVWPKMAMINNNVFINCRSAVDGSGGYYSFTVQNNIFGEQQTYATIARHGQDRQIIGGINTYVLNNIVLNPVNRNLEIPIPAVDSGNVMVMNNMFTRVNGCWIGDTTMERAATKYRNVKVSNNSYTPIYDVISFSLKDTYNEFSPKKLVVKLMVNKTIVWEKDLAGDDMDWKKYYVNISRQLIGGTNNIGFIFESKDSLTSKIYLDNIQIIRTEQGNCSFENSSLPWRLTPNGYGSRFVTEEFYDKIYSLRLQVPNRPETAILSYQFKK